MKGILAIGVVALSLGACVSFASKGGVTNSPAVDVIGQSDLLLTPVGGLEKTRSTATPVTVSGQPFGQALRVTIGSSSLETNATQLTIQNTVPVEKDDLLLATFYVRGKKASGKPSNVEFLFERASSPWTKSVSRTVTAATDANVWKKVEIPFTSAEKYKAREAMASIRLAFGPQEVFLAGLTLANFGKSLTLDQLYARLYADGNIPTHPLSINLNDRLQTLDGLGGNFCQPRYGSQDSMDQVGTRLLETLNVRMARIGIPLNHWAPERGRYNTGAQAKASFEAMRLLKSKGIPIIASVWEPPRWLMGGKAEQMGLGIPEKDRNTLIEVIGEYLKLAKKAYGVEPAYFSFNEPDYGVNVKLTPAQYVQFIREASKAWSAKGIKIKFLIGDTANGTSLAPYVEAKMAAADIRNVLGPIAYHTWDALSASPDVYEGIAKLGQKYKKPIWGTEAGHDAQLWQKSDPWASWENALNLSRAYIRSFRLTGAARLDYWTYQDNYSLLDPKTLKPFSVFQAVKWMEEVFAAGRVVVGTSSLTDDFEHIATTDSSRKSTHVFVANPGGPKKIVLYGLTPRTRLTVQIGVSSGYKPEPEISVAKDGTAELSVPARSVALLKSL